MRIVNNKGKESKANVEKSLLIERTNLMKERKVVGDELKESIEQRIKEIEEDIVNEIDEDTIKNIVETLKELGGEEHSLGGNGRKQMWKLLKKKFPKILPVVPVGKKDRHRNLITNHEGLKICI